MRPRAGGDPLVRDTPLLAATTPVVAAVRCVLDAGLPALPVVGVIKRADFVRAVAERFAASR